MKPILYLDGTVNFDNNGIGVLKDRIQGEVVNELNGKDEYTFTYPVTGAFYGEIKLRSIIKTKADDKRGLQLYRVYAISKPFNGIVTVNCEHISYDLNGIAVSRCNADNAPAAMQAIKSNSVNDNPFTFWTDKTTVANFNLTEPATARRCLGGMQGSILDVYGGEYEFDNFMVRLYTSIGKDNGVSLRYGKNLTDLTQEENCASVYTGLYPYWLSPEGSYLELPEKIVKAEGTFGFVRILPINFSDKFSEQPTMAQLRQAANTYITANKIGVPRVSLQLSYIQLETALGLEGTAIYERIDMGDIIHVYFEKLGIETTARVVETRYNDELERYNSIQIGSVRANISDTMAAQSEELRDIPNSPALQQAAIRASARITGNMGGNVVLHSSTGSVEPDELLVMDTRDIATANRVWRLNLGGFGYSKTGYNGLYGTAITMDGEIVADYITTGALNAAMVDVINLNASNITAGYLRSSNYSYTSGTFADAGFNLDLASGQIRTKQFTLTSAGNAYFAGNLSAAGGTFAGNLSAVGGTFKGSLSAVDGTFTNLTGTGSIKLGNANVLPEAIQLIRSDINKRLDLFLPQSGRAYVTSNCDINLGGYDSGAYYNTSLFGARIFFTCTDTGYNMSYYLPGTNEAALAPDTAGTCNIGTNTYYFDYIHANTVTQHSLRKDKTDITDLSDADYDIDKMRPIVYRIKPKKDKPRGELQIGLIAEELEKCCYKACSHDENGKLYGIDYSRLAVVAIKELQTLRKRVKELEERTA